MLCSTLHRLSAVSSFIVWRLFPSSHAFALDNAKKAPVVWKYAEIDYSAANEYIRSHYRKLIDNPYFASTKEDGRVLQPIYNAREGFWDENTSHLVNPSLSECGFALQHAPSQVTDYTSVDQIRSVYLPLLRHKVIPDAFGEEKITDIVFWHPMFRGDDQVIRGNIRESTDSLPTASIAPLAHIDTDIGAYDDVSEVVRLVHNNRIDDKDQARTFDPQRVEKALQSGRRFAIVNLWRNANREQPIMRAPLAVLSTRYKSLPSSSRLACFPEAKPDPSSSRWYVFPHMTQEECMLFLQYDRNVQKPSDLWHCALASIHEQGAHPRRSFDVRALVLFEEIVPPELDRFSADRLRPFLSRDESECFCREQASVEGRKVEALINNLKQDA